MTNAEKFEQIFGCKPDIDYVPWNCDEINCEGCKYIEKYSCNGSAWWDEEYNSQGITPAITLKETPQIFSCSYHLPCGWCEKRDMLCTQITTVLGDGTDVIMDMGE